MAHPTFKEDPWGCAAAGRVLHICPYMFEFDRHATNALAPLTHNTHQLNSLETSRSVRLPFGTVVGLVGHHGSSVRRIDTAQARR